MSAKSEVFFNNTNVKRTLPNGSSDSIDKIQTTKNNLKFPIKKNMSGRTEMSEKSNGKCKIENNTENENSGNGSNNISEEELSSLTHEQIWKRWQAREKYLQSQVLTKELPATSDREKGKIT